MKKFELASSVLTSAAKVRLVNGIWTLSLLPILHALVVPV